MAEGRADGVYLADPALLRRQSDLLRRVEGDLDLTGPEVRRLAHRAAAAAGDAELSAEVVDVGNTLAKVFATTSGRVHVMHAGAATQASSLGEATGEGC